MSVPVGSQFSEQLELATKLFHRVDGERLDDQHLAVDVESEAVEAEVATSLATLPRAVEALADVFNVRATLDPEGRSKGALHNVAAACLGEQHASPP